MFIGQAHAADFTPANHVVISEVYGGGGNSGANYKNDFIELYNPTTQDVDLTGWSIQYAAATGSFSSNKTTLSGTIKAHGYYLIQGTKGTGGTIDLPTPDVTSNLSLAGTAGKVALSKASDTITGKTDANLMDFVGFGSTATEFEGSGATVAPSNTKSVERKANDGTDPTTVGAGKGNGWDTDDNKNDFVAADPNPQNSSTPIEPSLGPTISDIKATNADGTLVNEGKTYTVEGTVTVANNIVGTNSYYIQDASGGINVYGDSSAVNPGDRVRVTGMISNFKGLAELTNPKDPSDATKTLPLVVEKIGTSSLPASVTTTVADLNDFAKAEPLEGKLVTVTGKATSIPTSLPGNVTIQDTTGKTLNVRLIATTGISLSSLQSNHTYSFTGLLGQYDSTSPLTDGYQLFPRAAADISEIFPLSLIHTPLKEAVKGADLQITATATGATSVKVFYKQPTDATFKSVDMTASTTDDTNYTATIPGADLTGSSFVYYIEAKNQTETQTAGNASTPFTVSTELDTTGPTINGEQPANQAKIESKQPEISVMMNDPSGVDASKVTIQVDSQDLTNTATITADKVLLPISADLAVGTHTVTVTAYDKKGNKTDDTWTFEIIPQFTGGNHYRGTTHNHTNISHDATGNPEDALKAAQAHDYDWFAFSDHSHDIDPEKLGQDTVTHKGMQERTGGTEWQTTKDLATQYTKNGSFVVFPAFEMTSTTWGHSNVFGTDNFIDRNIDNKKYQDLNSYYAWVLTYDNIAAQFNHPDMSANAFNNFMPYDARVDKLFTMLEVGNGSGNYGYANAEGKFFSALDLGWHVAPTFGEDNHDGTWGQTMKRTVIVAKDLSKDSLLDSMKNMRVYMEEDPNFTLDVLANGAYMGSTVDGSSLSFDIKGSDPVAESKSNPKYSYLPANYTSDDRIQKVELITNGQKVVQSIQPMTKDFTWKPNVPVTGGQQWFVVRVTQMDGERIYSAPIWTKEKSVDVRVSGIDVAGETIVAGTDANLTAGVSNLGTNDLTNLNVNFYYDNVDPNNKIGSATIDALQAKNVKQVQVTWKNPIAGDHTILAVVDAPQGDDPGDNQFAKQVSVKQQLGVTVMIDAAHGNENTSTDPGTYKNNFNLFTNLLKKEGYTVVENKNPLTVDTLAGVKVLVITHPTKDLTAAENTVVSDFVKNGGSLLLTDKSNFKNDTTINNDLLTQMGSSIQINNDGIYDDTKDGNFWANPLTTKFAVRIHTEPVANYITDQMPTPSVNYYSGSSLEGVGHTALTNSSTVTILGHGNESSYQSSLTGGGYKYDDVSDDHGGSIIPAIASEVIGSGKIIVSGMNFTNDKQLDESFNPVGNDEFTLNSINWLADRGTKVSTIGDVRKLPDDTNVVVEGTVTSGAGTFYDAFYLQDSTGGIMAFQEVPEGSLKLGDKVRVYGHVKTFENNKELEFTSFVKDVTKISSGEPIAPKEVTTKDSVSDANLGLLVKVTGKVVSKYDANSYVINDGSGDVLVFTDGYIVNQTGPIPDLKVGEKLEAVGFAGKFAEGNRIRVRDTKELVKVKDTSAPSTTAVINPTQPDGINGWYKNDVTITLTAEDDSSGIQKTEYSFDGLNWKDYESPFTVSSSTKVYYRSTDNAGNQEEQKDINLKVDKAVPVTVVVIDPSQPTGLNDWYTTDVKVTLTATDDSSGLQKTEYSLDGTNWKTYESPFTVSSSTKVNYRSIDNAGNQEEQKEISLKVDKTAPITNGTINPLQPNGTDGWYTTDVKVTLIASDDVSEVQKIEYSFDGINWNKYESSITVSSSTKMYYRSTDNAGNQESQKEIDLKVDKTAPTTTVSLPSPNNNGWFSNDVTVSLLANDEKSGVEVTQYRINSGEWTNYTAPFTISKDGEFTVQYRSIDKAGNTEEPQTTVVKLDKTAPVVKVSVDQPILLVPNHKMITIKATVAASDILSGVDSIVLESIKANEDLASDDIQEASIGTEDYTFALRAEREGKGNGRVYTITYKVTDKAGNVTRVTTTVTVPKGNSGK
ncbi:MAG: lamin tail domain-containing protein [Bacillota bacterium]|nr:lamin tail domain-containing protein [Bacillota bacterium]